MEKQFTRILFVRIAEPCKNEQNVFLSVKIA